MALDAFEHELLETTFRIHEVDEMLVLRAPDGDFHSGLVNDAAKLIQKQTNRPVLIMPAGIEFVRLEKLD